MTVVERERDIGHDLNFLKLQSPNLMTHILQQGHTYSKVMLLNPFWQYINWEPNIQIYESMRAIYLNYLIIQIVFL